MSITVRKVDLLNITPEESQEIIYLVNEYACDPMGGAEPLGEKSKKNLVAELVKRHDRSHIFIARDGTVPIGIAVCFEGFSTFNCQPLINIHDLVVISGYRAKGVGNMILAAVEEYGRSIDCCKLTLEVLEGNIQAQNAYKKFGFHAYELDPKMGKALFWEKKIG